MSSRVLVFTAVWPLSFASFSHKTGLLQERKDGGMACGRTSASDFCTRRRLCTLRSRTVGSQVRGPTRLCIAVCHDSALLGGWWPPPMQPTADQHTLLGERVRNNPPVCPSMPETGGSWHRTMRRSQRSERREENKQADLSKDWMQDFMCSQHA